MITIRLYDTMIVASHYCHQKLTSNQIPLNAAFIMTSEENYNPYTAR